MNQPVTKTELSRLGLEALDPEKAGTTSISASAGGVTFVDAAQVMQFAKLMAVADKAVPPHLRANPGACLRIVFQAVEWRMSPWAVADKSYLVNDRIAYESQLVHAVIEARAPLQHRLICTYSGELIYDETNAKDETTGETFVQRRLNWRKSTRKCTISGQFTNGDTRDYESPAIADIRVKNSPLWRDDPDQQLFYYASRSWARKWCPDVLMGIYSREELAERPDLGREDDAAAPGLHARLSGTVKGDEGHKPGFAESELEQVAAGSGGTVIEAKAEPVADTATDADKPTSGPRKAKKPAKDAPEPETPPAKPKNAKQWAAYCLAWIDAESDPDAIAKRWTAERKLRNDIGVTAEDRKPVEAVKDKRLVTLGLKPMGRMSEAAFGDEVFYPSTEAPLEKTPAQITRRGDPQTSYRAASGVVHKLRPIQLRVLAELKTVGDEGLTDFELEDRCGDHGSTFRTRRSELVEVGLVKDTGRVRNIKGHNRIVWAIA